MARTYSGFPGARRRTAVFTVFLVSLVIVTNHFTGEKSLLAEDKSKDETANIAKPGEVKKVGNMEFMYIPAGSFMMGSDKPDPQFRTLTECELPRHKVTLDGFWMGKYEVTQNQYKKIMGKNPSHFKGKDNPVEMVSWEEAMEFCKKFGKKYHVKARLPYEAEWEYACRAGSTTEYYWGDTIDGSCLWYSSNSGEKSHPVGKKKPNAFGLYDMSGNIEEWCMDWYDAEYYKESPTKNPQGPAKGKTRNRVLRGGSWLLHKKYARSAIRTWAAQARRNNDWGFRIVISER